MAAYDYKYNEESPRDKVKNYKHCNVYPNQVLWLGIFSLVFSGWLGIIFAVYALYKEKVFRAENDGDTCKMVRIGKILAIISLSITAALAVAGLIYLSI